MVSSLSLVAVTLLGSALAQRPDDSPEVHPKLTTWKCTTSGGCVEQDTRIVIDSLSHGVYQVDTPSKSCTGANNMPDSSACPDAETCFENCAIGGVSDYESHGVETNGGSLFLDMLSEDGSVYSPRVYLLAADDDNYEMLQLTGQELAFDVDVSKLPCGMNGALYLSEMEKDGGRSDLNPAGAQYGTGYCDAQCYTTPFLNGEANVEGLGACCNELDIWEANGRAQQMAPHVCNQTGVYGCSGAECEFDGVCDKNGCGYNPYVLGNPDYYGPGETVDTSRPFTVVTSFPANEDGVLTEIHRLYVQDGKVIQNAKVNVDYPPQIDFINDEYCEATGAARYMDLGATAEMGEAMARGMVLIFSIWWDEGGYMEWLDSGNAGPCVEGEGAPDVIRENQPDTSVVFKNIKWGDIGSTYGNGQNSTSRKH